MCHFPDVYFYRSSTFDEKETNKSIFNNFNLIVTLYILFTNIKIWYGATNRLKFEATPNLTQAQRNTLELVEVPSARGRHWPSRKHSLKRKNEWFNNAENPATHVVGLQS